MTLRRHLSLALFGALLFASPLAAHAQSEEDPEPEVSDQGPGDEAPDEQDPEPEVSSEGPDVWDRLLAFNVTGGIDTPFGVGGAAIEFSPIRYLAIYAGGGIGRSGGRVAGGIRGQAPIGNAAISLMLGVHGGPMDWDSRGRSNEAFFTSRYWEFALFFHSGIGIEYRWDMGLFVRGTFGVDALLTPGTPDACTIGAEDERMECASGVASGLAKPVRGWVGLTLGYALDL